MLIVKKKAVPPNGDLLEQLENSDNDSNDDDNDDEEEEEDENTTDTDDGSVVSRCLSPFSLYFERACCTQVSKMNFFKCS